jgi:hypothetical protein
MKSRIGRTLTSLAALVAAAAPVASHASENPALDRCVQIFVKAVVPTNRPVEIEHEAILASTRSLTATRSSVSLVARGEKNSKLIGRASCVIDRNGSIVAMYLYDAKPGPMGAGRPKVLARNVDARVAFSDDTKPF